VIPNLHCSSCTTAIHLLLALLTPPPIAISTNIVIHEVTVEHVAELNPNGILRILLEAEFEVDSINVSGPGVTFLPPGRLDAGRVVGVNHIYSSTHEESPLEDWGKLIKAALESGKRRKKHIEVCEMCRSQEKKQSVDSAGTLFSLSSRTSECSKAYAGAPVVFMDRRSGEGSAAEASAVESSAGKSPGYGGVVDGKSLKYYGGASYSGPAIPSNMFDKAKTSLSSPQPTPYIAAHITSDTVPIPAMVSSERPAALQSDVVLPGEVVPDISVNMAPAAALFEATFSIEGMTCSACTGKVNDTVGHLPQVKSVNVALMTNSATVEFEGVKEDAAKIVDEIEDIGYGCVLESIKELNADGAQIKTVERVVQIRVGGMFCE